MPSRADLSPGASGEPGSCWPRFRIALAALVLARGLMLCCVLPPFEGWDEYQHVAYVVHALETGRAALLGETAVPRSLLGAAVAYPFPRSVVRHQLGGLGMVTYDDFFARHDPRKPGTSPPAPQAGGIGLYQAQHASLYYRLAAPVFAGFGGVARLGRSVAALRLVNVGLVALSVGVAAEALRRACRRERDAALIALVLACHPLYLMNGARVANDALGVALAALAVAACLGFGGSGSRRRALLVGLLIGLAALAKASNFALIPVAAFAWLAHAARARPGFARAATTAGLMAAGFLLVTQAELRFNLSHFGGLTPMQEAVLNHRNGRTLGDLVATARTFSWPRDLRRLWVRELFYAGGWSSLHTKTAAIQAYQLGVTFGLLGWAWHALARVWPGTGSPGRAVFRSATVPAACLVLVAALSGAVGYHMVHSKLAWGYPSTNPWYGCPGLPWFLALAVGGALAWPLGDRPRLVVPLGLAATGLAAEQFGVWGPMLATYSGGARGAEALSRLAALQPPWLGTPTLVAALAAQGLACLAVARWLPGSVGAGQGSGPRALGRVSAEPAEVVAGSADRLDWLR